MTNPEQRLLRTQEVAALLRVHRCTLYSVPGLMECRVDIGGRGVRYDAKKVDALLTPKASRARKAA